MKLIFEYDEQNSGHLSDEDISITLPKDLTRTNLPLPNVSEIEVIRHYTNLSKKNQQTKLICTAREKKVFLPIYLMPPFLSIFLIFLAKDLSSTLGTLYLLMALLLLFCLR